MSKKFKTLVSVSLSMEDWKALINSMAQMDTDTLKIVQNVSDQFMQVELDSYSYEKDYGYAEKDDIWDKIANEINSDLDLFGDDLYVDGDQQLENEDIDSDNWNKVYWS